MKESLSTQRLSGAAEGGHGQAQDLKSVDYLKGPSASTLLYLTESSCSPFLHFVFSPWLSWEIQPKVPPLHRFKDRSPHSDSCYPDFNIFLSEMIREVNVLKTRGKRPGLRKKDGIRPGV